jgi:hypothetical protein
MSLVIGGVDTGLLYGDHIWTEDDHQYLWCRPCVCMRRTFAVVSENGILVMCEHCRNLIQKMGLEVLNKCQVTSSARSRNGV